MRSDDVVEGSLQLQIKRGFDHRTGRSDTIHHKIHKMRRIHRQACKLEMHRRTEHEPKTSRIHPSQVSHAMQDPVLFLEHRLAAARPARIISGRRPGQGCKDRSFNHIDVLYILVEIPQGCQRGPAEMTSHGRKIEIKLKDLVLGELRFHFDRREQFH